MTWYTVSAGRVLLSGRVLYCLTGILTVTKLPLRTDGALQTEFILMKVIIQHSTSLTLRVDSAAHRG